MYDKLTEIVNRAVAAYFKALFRITCWRTQGKPQNTLRRDSRSRDLGPNTKQVVVISPFRQMPG
jgi:hypothetical protein